MGALCSLNALDEARAREALTRCCGAQAWVSAMLACRPFASRESLLAAAERLWRSMERADILEAFTHHPRIGADMAALRQKFAPTAAWSLEEQSGALSASEATLRSLQQANLDYEARFGHIFIVCATGKSADEMLALLEARLTNHPDAELAIAAEEQAKITRLRLLKLFDAP
jgi:2-oxo-4-hydroxy-4-carboxy-5-ureidoimidazoline decarboxylase